MESKFQHSAGTRGHDKPANIPGNSGTQRGQTKEQEEVRDRWIPYAKRQGGSGEACKDPRPDSEEKKERGRGDDCHIGEETGPAS